MAQPIEEQLVGLDGMLYYLSTSANNGTLNISGDVQARHQPDIATVQTQNRVSVAMPRLPPEVQRQGVAVKKVSSAFLMAISLVSTDNRYDSLFLTNYAQINLVNQMGSLPGIGDSRLGSNQVYSMRVWVNPDKMAKLGITATDISNAIQAQNRQNPAGAFGQPPAPPGTDFQYSVNAPGRLVDPRQFDDIVLRAQPGRLAAAHPRHRPRASSARRPTPASAAWTAAPSGNVIVYLSPGRERRGRRRTACARTWSRSRRASRPGMDYIISYDSTMFVRAAIKDVMITLFEAIGLVILVVFLFLQNWRATLIPLLTVPVAVVGTFALFPLLGFSINITSMFGLVLAIGIVVDDAIVVVEAVQRHIDEGMAPREATIQAMKEVSAPVVAIAFILAAVFIPVAFLGGISGQIYKQFALTIAASVLLSAFNALSLSPALSAMMLRPKRRDARAAGRLFRRVSTAASDGSRGRYLAGVSVLIRRSALALIGCFCFWLAAGAHLPPHARRLPAG